MPKRPVQRLRVACEPVVVARGGGAAEAAGQREIAVDPLLGDEAVEVLARGLRLGQDGGGSILAETLGELGMARAQIAAGDAAVARRRSLARALPVEHLDRAAGAGEPDRGSEPGVAGADDDHVRGGRHRLRLERHKRRIRPPVDVVLPHRSLRPSAAAQLLVIGMAPRKSRLPSSTPHRRRMA